MTLHPRLDDLRAAFQGRLLTDPDEMRPFLVDWRGRWEGRAWAVVQPDTAQDVAAVVGWCARTATPVVPQGGNTGLSGGATPDDSGDAIVLSLNRLNRIRALDTVNNTITVEAGCVLQAVQTAAAEAGRLFPLSLAAEGSCTIGGNLATNAGGVGVLRYGSARDLCLGLEAATADGALWDGLRGLRKDNTGFDLRDLYIGSEGALGVITAAVLKLYPTPVSTGTAFLAVPSPEAALAVLQLARDRLGDGVVAFEMLSDICLSLVVQHMPATRSPLATASPWYVLMEIAGADAGDVLSPLLEAAFEADLLTDATIAASLDQSRALWALRENISEAQGRAGKTIKHDIALPISSLGRFIAEVEPQLARFAGVTPVIFGHLGDGNLHFNLSPAPGADGEAFVAMEPAINLLVHDAVAAHGGSISAEHGLGVLRRDEADRYRSPVETRLMWAIKRALDPQGIMNPGKVLAP